jgi:hypothetical protein
VERNCKQVFVVVGGLHNLREIVRTQLPNRKRSA